MRRSVLLALCAALVALAGCCCPWAGKAGAPGAPPMLAHNVFFTLKEDTPQHREALIAACRAYLTGHPGEVFFAAGSLAEDLTREVNVRDFQVALHIVFAEKKFQDEYQVAPRHKEFVEKFQALWQQVRVYDTYVR
jgi:hypothetical protein